MENVPQENKYPELSREKDLLEWLTLGGRMQGGILSVYLLLDTSMIFRD